VGWDDIGLAFALGFLVGWLCRFALYVRSESKV